MKKLSFIIVNYNVKEFLQNLLQSLSKATRNIPSEIIVVDNASTDGSVEVVREKHPEVKLIANDTNVGFGAANNMGFEQSEGEYAVLINPDTIVKEDTFEKLLAFFERTPDAGIAGCKVLNPDGSLQLPCRRSFPGPWTSFTKVVGLSKLFPKSKLFAKYNLTYMDENDTYEVDAISGAFMMVRREVYQKINGFDTDFFMYGEDLDFCYRTQKLGYNVYYFHETEIIHYKGESTKRSSLDETNVFYKAMTLFVKKHLSTSFLVELILHTAIYLRKLVAWANIYKLIVIAAVIDFIAFAGALRFAEYLYSNPGGWQGFPVESYPWVYLLPPLVQAFISSAAGAYKRNALSILRILISLFVGLVVLSSIVYFFKQFGYSRAVFLITYGLLLFAFPLWRIIAKLLFKVGLPSEARKHKTVIVGTSETATKLAKKLKASFTDLYDVAGLIGSSFKEVGEVKEEFRVIGSVDNLKKIITEDEIDFVIFSSDEISFRRMFTVIAQTQDANVEFKVAGTELDYMVGKSAVSMLDNIPLLNLNYNITAFPHTAIKRTFDVALSVPVLLFIYPFIYSFTKLTRKENDFSRFVLKAPKVFSGKYSFVGPYSNKENGNLYLGKEGLTGFWYTEKIEHGDKEELSKLNIYYARNQSIWLDLEILGKTWARMFLTKR